jgi:hypothetical protein
MEEPSTTSTLARSTTATAARARAARLWRGWPRKRAWLLAGAVVLLLSLAWQSARRVVFPWDTFATPESAFMTNMLRLSLGEPLFGDPAHANNGNYVPTAEIVAFVLLRPLGLENSPPACRIVCIAMGIAAALLAAIAARAALRKCGCNARGFAPLAAATVVLLLACNCLFDTCAPDNFVALYVCLVFALLARAVLDGNVAYGAAAAFASAFAPCAAQLLAPLPVTVVLALGLAATPAGARFDRTQRWVFFFFAFFPSLVVWLSIAASYGAWWSLWNLYFEEATHWGRAYTLAIDILGHPARAILVALAPACAFLALLGPASLRSYLWCWLALAPAGVASLASYLRATGSWHELTLLDCWLSTLVLPVLWCVVPWNTRRAGWTAAPRARRSAEWGAAAAWALLLMTTFPAKIAPSASQYELCRAIEVRLRADARDGVSVLLPFGTAIWTRAGMPGLPLDRMTHLSKLFAAGGQANHATLVRLRGRYYKKVYLFVAWYDRVYIDAIRQNFQEQDWIPGDRVITGGDELSVGSQGLLHEPVAIMERRQ